MKKKPIVMLLLSTAIILLASTSLMAETNDLNSLTWTTLTDGFDEPILVAQAQEGEGAEDTLSPECAELAKDPDADLGEVIRAGCKPTLAQMSLDPLRRGRVKLTGFTVLRPDPLGVFNGCRRIGEAQSVLVLPRRYPVDWQAVFGRVRDRPGGASQTASTGGVDEFAALREYRPGDPLRHIDWKGGARLGIPIVKEFHETCFVRHGLILDTFPPAGASAAGFEEAVSVAASFVDTARVGDGVLELLFVGSEVYRASAGQGAGSTDRLLEALACVESCHRHPFETLRSARP